MDRSGGRACAGRAGGEVDAQGRRAGERYAVACRDRQDKPGGRRDAAQLRLRDANFADIVGQCLVVRVQVAQRMRERRRLTEQQGQCE